MENEVVRAFKNCERDIYLLDKFAINQTEANKFFIKRVNDIYKSNKRIGRSLMIHGVVFAMFGGFGAALAYNDICHDKKIRELKAEVKKLKTEKGE